MRVTSSEHSALTARTVSQLKSAGWTLRRFQAGVSLKDLLCPNPFVRMLVLLLAQISIGSMEYALVNRHTLLTARLRITKMLDRHTLGPVPQMRIASS
ncbi:hypothetical protein FOPG_19739 [Fusarium oxysporum f. sp. conglutinans race 2 54008]|uniref:Uncharacterized protein n=1 Tax=Fusarium oxysporum f. sp. conglutinans race 2 54008 TaxID=1089457 RepID=X0GK31_FUSOX|nr:hypothetical protein FOPG_19739 [Fusarium oxysporum f. sp. conglutinans race 2 54008]